MIIMAKRSHFYSKTMKMIASLYLSTIYLVSLTLKSTRGWRESVINLKIEFINGENEEGKGQPGEVCSRDVRRPNIYVIYTLSHTCC